MTHQLRNWAVAILIALAVPTALHAAPPETPAAGHGRYVVSLWIPGTLLPGQKHGDTPRKLAEPDFAQYEGTVVQRNGHELVVDMPLDKARALRRHEAVMFVQRVWMGEDLVGWNEKHPRKRLEVETQSDTDVTWQAQYAYDAAGNVATMSGDTFSYDGVDRVLSGTVGGKTESYEYDAFGNRVGVVANGITIATPADSSTNRLIGPVYDFAGNVTDNGKAQFTYDSFNMVTYATGLGVTPRRFIYDADDERLGWITQGLCRWTARDFSGRTLREFKSDSLSREWQWQHDYIYADGALVAGEQQEWGYTEEFRYGGDRHYHLDHLGSVRIVSNEQGRSVAEYSYAAFGVQQNATNQEQAWLNPNVDNMRFAGHNRDFYAAAPEYGGAYLDYMHARYYSPAVGRFMSVDPVLGAPNQPQSWNRYSYALNNPVNLVDPDGRCGERPAVRCEVTLSPPPNAANWTEAQRAAENAKNANRAKLAEEGKVIVSRDAPRPSSSQLAAANGGSAPAGSHLDHKQEIVLGGNPLAKANIESLDATVNMSNGSRVKAAIRGLANGTVITKFNYTVLGTGGAIMSLVQLRSFHQFMKNQQQAHPGFVSRTDMVRWVFSGDTSASAPPCSRGNPC